MAEIQGLEGVTFESAISSTILEELGRGGMGIVYLAERCCLDVKDLVVLKTIRNVTRELEERLRREATVATGLRHDNVVRTLGLEAIPYASLPDDLVAELDREPSEDRKAAPRRRRRNQRLRQAVAAVKRRRVVSAGSARPPKRGAKADDRKLLLLVMDYVEGIDVKNLLKDHLDAGHLIPVPLAAFIVAQVCRALAYAHKQIIHRDISPDNVLINQHGVCKLSDFGIAAAEGDASKKLEGKVAYMAPETSVFRTYDERSDVFSLGVCFYQLLTGIRPFWVDGAQPLAGRLAQMRAQVEAGVPGPSEVRSDVPEVLSRIVRKMIAADPRNRYSRAGTIADEIEQEYLYARGIGPTNQSLAAYLRFFESEFQETDSDDVGQLSFLRDERGRLRVQRPNSSSDLTPAAIEWLRARPGMVLPAPRPQPVATPVLRVLVGEGLIESFALGAEPLTVGSDPTNGCILPDLARRHARFVATAERILFESAGGEIRIGGAVVDRCPVSEGAKLRIGPYPASVVYEKPVEEAKVAVDVAPGASLPPVDDPAARSIVFRFDRSPESARETCRLLGAALADVEMSDALRADFSTGLEQTVLFLTDTVPRRMELRTFPVRARIVVALQTADDARGLHEFFLLLKRAATVREASDVKVRTPIRGIDRIEYRHQDGSLRIGTTLA